LRTLDAPTVEEHPVPNLIWIIIVVLVVLALLGYFGRGRFRG
jgi:flagellar basal body-associated protein FliL